MEYIIVVFVILAFLAANVYYNNKRTKERIAGEIEKNWGAYPDVELTPERMKAIGAYYELTKRKNLDVDDITWNDVSMDEIFEMLDNTSCSIGEEYLYALLRKLEYKEEVLEEREKMISYYQEQEKERTAMQTALMQMGKLRGLSFYKGFHNVTESVTTKGIHLVYCLAMAASIIGIVICAFTALPVNYFLLLFIACLANNIVQYYRRKAEIEKHLYLLVHILKLLYSVDVILELDSSEITPYKKDLQNVKSSFSSFRRKAKFVANGNNMSGSLSDMIMDYIRMLFHVDLIMFDSMIKDIDNKTKEMEQAYEIIGKIDSSIAIASFRTYLEGDYCIPRLYQQTKPKLDAKDMYHPLIDDPVKNSISETSCVLITGSNASGKSTFIKTVAINAILAQTIHTCMCSEYNASFFKVYSSMALTDNLQENESYYIVEIKSLKRIIDQAKDKIPTLCFVDEVLRGTNTLERIAASSQILKYVSGLNAFCFAATHDIELTYILERYFVNYHFQEEVKEDQVLFNYELKEGRATSRNAIKLLKMMDYPEEVIRKAGDEVTHFTETGVWNTISG